MADPTTPPTQYPVDPKNADWKPRKVGQFDIKKAEDAAKPPAPDSPPDPKTVTVYGYRDPRANRPVHTRPDPIPAPLVIVLAEPVITSTTK